MYYLFGKRRHWAISICGLAALICSSLASRAYPNGCADQPISYYDYDSYSLTSSAHIPIRSHDDFLILRRLGVGKFSDVFEAVDIKLMKKSSKLHTAQNSLEQTLNGIHPKAVCVVKCLKPVSERKVKRELLVLSHTRNLPNMVRLLGVVLKDPHVLIHSSSNIKNETSSGSSAVKINEMPSLVFNHVGSSSRWLCHGVGVDSSVAQVLDPPTLECNVLNVEQHPPFHLTEYEIKYYLCHLLIALDSLHEKGIMHRDVKPRNIMVNRIWPVQSNGIHRNSIPNSSNTDVKSSLKSPTSQGEYDDATLSISPLVLIDFGLADFYLPNKSYNVRVASRHYKAPELLLGYEYYDYGIDMWGVGCILAGLLFRREPFFRGRDNTDQLGKLIGPLIL